MEPLKTLRYEWHIRWEAIDDKGNPETGFGDLEDTCIESLNRLIAINPNGSKHHWLTITDEDIARGYCLTGEVRDFRSIGKCELVYRLALARYFESDYGNDIGIAIIRDNQLEDYFDNGVRVPKRFKQEFARHYKWASIL